MRLAWLPEIAGTGRGIETELRPGALGDRSRRRGVVELPGADEGGRRRGGHEIGCAVTTQTSPRSFWKSNVGCPELPGRR